MFKHLNIKIHGRVQGVFFRDTTKRKADELGLAGFAGNEPDGTVYVEAEGEEENLKRFLEYCRQGPRTARVEKIEHEFSGGIKGFKNFQIKH